jgi:hypothetical protein
MAKILVGCKIPNGFQINLYGQDNTISASAVLKGAHHSKIAGGWGVTEVDKDLWDAWHKQHQHHPAVKAGFIFAHEKADSIDAKAKEMTKVKTGFEGIDPHDKSTGVKPDESMEAVLKKAAA